MAQIQVSSWSKLSEDGGYNASAVNIGINTEDIIGVETRATAYATTGVTNIYYNYKVNNKSILVLLIVTQAIGALGTGLIPVDSYTGFNGINNLTASAILINGEYIKKIQTRTSAYQTDGITDIGYNMPANSSFNDITLIVKQTLAQVITAATTADQSSSGVVSATTTVKGIVNQAAVQADFAGADITALKVELNVFLAKLRTSGVLAT